MVVATQRPTLSQNQSQTTESPLPFRSHRSQKESHPNDLRNVTATSLDASTWATDGPWGKGGLGTRRYRRTCGTTSALANDGFMGPGPDDLSDPPFGSAPPLVPVRETTPPCRYTHVACCRRTCTWWRVRRARVTVDHTQGTDPPPAIV